DRCSIRARADQDHGLFGIGVHQLGQKCSADTAPAQTRFDAKGEIWWRVRLIAQSPNPNGTEQLTALCVMRNESGIIRATPAVDVARELRTLHGVPWRSALGRVKRLIQHLPQNRLIRGCEPANLVIHSIESCVRRS